MTKIVNARIGVGAAIDPAQLIAQTVEEPTYLAQVQSKPATPAARADKERRFLRNRDLKVT